MFDDDKKRTPMPGDADYKGGIFTTYVTDESGQTHRVVTTKDANGNIVNVLMYKSTC